MSTKEGPLTSLGCNDSNIVPVLAFPIQFHGSGDEACVWGDTKQSLWVRLRINGEPGGEKIGGEARDKYVGRRRVNVSERGVLKERVKERSKQGWQQGAE